MLIVLWVDKHNEFQALTILLFEYRTVKRLRNRRWNVPCTQFTHFRTWTFTLQSSKIWRVRFILSYLSINGLCLWRWYSFPLSHSDLMLKVTMQLCFCLTQKQYYQYYWLYPNIQNGNWKALTGWKHLCQLMSAQFPVHLPSQSFILLYRQLVKDN